MPPPRRGVHVRYGATCGLQLLLHLREQRRALRY